MHSGTGKHPHTLQREGPVGKQDPKNRIHKGGHQSDPCTWSVVEVLSALWLTHSVTPQCEQRTKTLLTEILSKSLGFRKCWPRCVNLNAVNASQVTGHMRGRFKRLFAYIERGIVYQPQSEHSGTPNVHTKLLRGFSDLIPFFRRKVIFWIPVIRGVTSLIGKEGG